ncbi:HSP20-like chaperone [Dichotomocladium elegans]|nr:HSP20-like chaperone [Dichotomocladium elegans]
MRERDRKRECPQNRNSARSPWKDWDTKRHRKAFSSFSHLIESLTAMPLHPSVLWAQRKDLIYLTVEVTDINKPVIEVKPNSFHFKGKGEKEQNEYEAEIEFYAAVDVEKSKQHLTPRNLTMIIYKKEEGFWPKLQKGNKLNFVKVDFSRWKDEDEEDDDGLPDPMGGMDFQSLMAQAGGNMPNMDDLPEDDSDSDDEDEEAKDSKTSKCVKAISKRLD